jgi:EmrB/QacA subfamily drug resistance transporter
MTTATARAGHPRRWAILGVMVLALFGIAMDNTVLVIALPVLARDLHASTSQLQWMIDAYTLIFAGLLLLAGTLSDRFGRKKLLLAGLVIFGAGSALTPLVGTPEQLIALRAFMGLGAALTTPPTLSIIADVFPEQERPKAIAAWSATMALGIVAGPILGGVLLEHFSWPSVFVVNVPVVAAGCLAALAIVPESRAPGEPRLDLVGAGLSVAAVVALTYAFIEAPGYGWGDARIVAALVVAAVGGVAFGLWERRVAHPMLDVALFRNARFSAACLSVTLAFFALNGALFLLTLYLQEVRRLSPLDTGYRFLSVAAGIAVGAILGAWLTNRLGARIATSLGLAAIAAGMVLAATLTATSDDLLVAKVLFTSALGIGIAMTPATDAIMGAVPPEQFGVGSAVNDTTRELGGAFGIAILGSFFSNVYASHIADAAAQLPGEAGRAVRESFAGAAAVAALLPADAANLLMAKATDAFMAGMQVTCLIGVAFAVAGVLAAAIFLPSRAREVGKADGEATLEPAGR